MKDLVASRRSVDTRASLMQPFIDECKSMFAMELFAELLPCLYRKVHDYAGQYGECHDEG